MGRDGAAGSGGCAVPTHHRPRLPARVAHQVAFLPTGGQVVVSVGVPEAVRVQVVSMPAMAARRRSIWAIPFDVR